MSLAINVTIRSKMIKIFVTQSGVKKDWELCLYGKILISRNRWVLVLKIKIMRKVIMIKEHTWTSHKARGQGRSCASEVVCPVGNANPV